MNAGYIQKHCFIKTQFTLDSHLLRILPRVFHSNIPIKKNCSNFYLSPMCTSRKTPLFYQNSNTSCKLRISQK